MLTGPRIGSLFSGYGGLDMGVQQAVGGTVAWHCDFDTGPSKVLKHRWPDVPNLHDVTAVDWAAVDPVDVITGGSPCQDVSHAGKRAGMRAGTRSGLWASMCDAIDIIRPSLVVWENVRGALSAPADSSVEPCPICVGDNGDVHLRALGRVLGDLAELGYDASWVGVRASDAGAPHARFRVFVAAWPAAQDPDLAAGRERGLAAPGEAEGGRARSDAGRRGGTPAADADYSGREVERHVLAAAAEHPAAERRGDAPVADTGRERRGEGQGIEPQQPSALGGLEAEELNRRGAAAANALGGGLQRRGGPGAVGSPQAAGEGHGGERERDGDALGGGSPAAADPDGGGQQGFGWVHPGGGDADRRDSADGPGIQTEPQAHLSWGAYAAAVARWAHVSGRPAPAPTEPRRTGGARLSPRFVEWLMGLPDGHVTAVPGLTRNEQLKLLGNGVVPAQAALALQLMGITPHTAMRRSRTA